MGILKKWLKGIGLIVLFFLLFPIFGSFLFSIANFMAKEDMGIGVILSLFYIGLLGFYMYRLLRTVFISWPLKWVVVTETLLFSIPIGFYLWVLFLS